MRRKLRGWRLTVAASVALVVVYAAISLGALIFGVSHRDQALNELRKAAVDALPAGAHLVGSGFIVPDQGWAVGSSPQPPATLFAAAYQPGGADRWVLINAAARPGERNYLNAAKSRILTVSVTPCAGRDCPAGGSRIQISVARGGPHS